jgi:D-alanyl-lipoteichoic acid acyltransferase DltB (MBOAT superfamily)
MLFNSIDFLVFLPVVLLLYYVLSTRAQNAWLLLASYVFYGWWDWRFLGLILISTVVDFWIGQQIALRNDNKSKRRFLAVSILTNLGILGIFKYYGFFVQSFVGVLEAMGVQAHVTTLQIVLPVGISFYTFQTMSYSFDIYRGRIGPTRNFLNFALFVAYFPQLVAGPIERAHHLLPKLEASRRIQWLDIAVGFELVLIGFFKKVAVADTLGPMVDSRFADPSMSSGLDLVLTTYLFAFQIYADFSGYADIARGTSRFFGVDLMRNFNQPYLSQSITEFWRRWHISLSTWLRDYLYIPLGGNRKGTRRTYVNLMTTMLLGGLWHGANWTFVIWGGLHGLYLACHKVLLRGTRVDDAISRRGSIMTLVKILVTFHLVCVTWIFFRANDLASAVEIISRIVLWEGGSPDMPAVEIGERIALLIGTLVLVDWLQAKRGDHAFMVSWHWIPRAIGYALLILMTLTIGNLIDEVPFIYFQF